MASADLRDELLCSICLSTYTNPVMLRCGHNFCRVCIDRVLDTQDKSGVYSCPGCREEFQERPALMRNFALCNIVKNFLHIESPQEEITGVFCTYCVDSPVSAVRSCLHCEASLCDKHLRSHSKSPEHVLSDPSTSLEKRKCSVHKKILEYYCTEDAACICVSCSLAGEHRGHRVELLDEASEKKEKLRNVLQKLITKREETEERVRNMEERRRMSYPSTDRRGQQSLTGNNNKSWGLWWYNNQYTVRHDRKEIRLPDKISSDRFRICLDYGAGQLSFYELCDPIRHLHTFTATFSEPLHAALCVWHCSIKILG